MKLSRIFAHLIGFFALVSSALVYLQYVYLLGFPDGFISALGYAQRRLAYVFIGISIALGSYFIYLGLIASQQQINRKLFAAFILYLIFIVSMLLKNYYYQLHLPGSTGG